MLKSYKIYTCTNGALGLHLSRAPWDPYPWVSSIQKESTSYQAGLRIGDCLLELNGQDVLGMKISEIAALLKNHWLNESSNYVTVVIWRNKCNNNNNSNGNSEDATTDACNNNEDDDDDDDDEDEENNAHNINQQSLQKFATCLQHIAQLLECPVCLEVIKPPGWQCCNGHVLCNNCRSRSEKCPVCRVPLGPRGRCLLSDKLFTLLADSFPCDGVRSNKNSPKDRRKCSTEFHNQPKMAIVKKHHQQQHQQQERDEQQGAKKAKDFLLTSLRHRRRKISSSKMSQHNNEEGHAGEAKDEQEQENKHSSMQKQAIYDDTNVGVGVTTSSFKRNCNNRKSTPDYIKGGVVGETTTTTMTTTFRNDELHGQTSTIEQCHCITCYKPDKVAIVNNVTTLPAAAATTASASLNKYILRIPSQGQLEQLQQQQHEEKYQNYQCPTGKLCCLTKNVMPHATCTRVTTNTANTTPLHASMTNNNLSTTATTTKQTTPTVLTSGHQHLQQQHQVNVYNFHKILKNEWDILAHLTQDHQLPVNQYYAEYGQRIKLQNLSQHSITCLNLKGTDENDSKVEKFFIACIPLEMTSTTATATVSKVAIFLYYMNSVANIAANTATTTITSASTSLDDEVSNFETIIENPLTGIKWFGRAHPLTTPWSHIHEKQHFLQHNVLQNHLDVVSGMGEAAVNGSDAFVIVVKRKFEIKTKI